MILFFLNLYGKEKDEMFSISDKNPRVEEDEVYRSMS
jgi:hypothetical protein